MCSGGGGSAKQVQYEPVKSAEQTMQEASSDAARSQQLRRGIASTFSRQSMGASGGGTGATSGTGAKLGS